ncbi:YkvA family protein [Hoeflea poritis]|uniref:YkvA family protein n=1 Tax=Hoeflea poritis TaxID=2993659 RepID=A0ABT4VLN1_9HYPH|nr:YkvA family protein [Hoeflea poritis]MDA4845514.1 YkvA family protein [Hoeflea poritis]
MDDVKIGEILEPGDEDTRQGRERRVRDKFWATARRAARQVPFMEDVVAAYYCAFDLNTPHRVRGILLAALAYFVLPLDGLPDFLAFVGFSDDVAVLAAALAAIRAHITPAHYAAARAALTEEGAGAASED